MQASIATVLGQHPLLADCAPLELARLLSGTVQCEFAAGTDIFQAGAAADYYYWILAGEAELVAANERWQLGADQGFGAEAFADVPRHLVSARAATTLSVLRIARAAVRELTATHPDLKSAALVDLAARMGRVTAPAEVAVEKRAPASMPVKQRVGWVATLILPPLAYLAADMAGLPQHSAIYLGLFTMTAVMWLFTVVDEYIPPLIAIVAMLFIELVPARVALAGFYSRAFLLLLGVYALSAVLVSSGLAYRFMLWVLLKSPDRPFWHRAALTVFGGVLSIVMPSSNARLALLLPLYREMDGSLGARSQSREATALMVATFTGATLFSPLLLTSKSANLAAYTMLPVQVRLEFQGAYWLVAAGVVALGLLLFHLLAMRFFYRAEHSQPLPRARLAGQLALLGPLGAREWIALLAFLVFLLGAALPQWHQTQTGWLAAFVLISLLALGLFDKQAFQTKIDWPIIFFLLSLDGFTDAINYLGLRDVLVSAIGDRLDWINGELGWFILLALLVTVLLRLFLPITAGMVMAVTLLLPVGLEQGIHPWLVVFLASLFSDIWFLPYQNSSYAQALAGGLRQRCSEALFLRYAWWLNPLRVLLAYASIPYWRWLGLY